MELLGFLMAIIIGIILGILGGGGSILSVPVLVYLFHLNPLKRLPVPVCTTPSIILIIV